MAKVKDILSIPVKVNPVLREYLVCIHGGSDLIPVDYQGPVWTVVKTHLDTIPNDWTPDIGGSAPDRIRLLMPTSHSGKRLYNQTAGAVIQTNYLYRSYLSEKGQRRVESILMKTFKDNFRQYMTGYLSSVRSGAVPKIKDAIESFCELYQLEMEAVTYEMLKKDWYRYRNRETPYEPDISIKESF